MHCLRSCVLVLLSIASLAAPAAHAWPHAPNDNVLVSLSGYAFSPRTVSDGAGGCFVAYADYRNGNPDIFMQHYDAVGNPLWAAVGVNVCSDISYQYPVEVIADGFGGAIVVWTDYRDDFNYGDLYANRVNSAGSFMWATNGSMVCGAASYQTGVKIVADRQGGAHIVWEDSRDEGTNQRDIYMQHIAYYGNPMLGPNGLAIAALASNASQPDLEVTESGDAIVVWADSRSGPDDIYGQRISSAGTPSWGATGMLICTANYYQFAPQIELLPLSRVLVAWTDNRSSSSYAIYAQVLLASSGTPLQVANGVPVCNSPSEQHLIDMVADGLGGMVLVWSDAFGGAGNLYAQKVNPSCVAQWAANGVPVLTASSYYAEGSLVADGTGGVLASWRDMRSDGGDIYAQRLRADGTVAWKLNGVGISTSTGEQQLRGMAPLSNGGALLVWDDYRPSGYNARMQAVDEWGYLGAEPIMADVRDIPNDQGGQVKVTWAASPLDYDAAFRNITAYTVFRSVPQQFVSEWFATSASDGRVAQATTNDGRKFRRMRFGAQDYYWEELARITPRHVTAYSYVAATEGDSVGGSNPVTVFMIGAETANGTSFWFTQPDSGYSVDNLPPAAPAPLTGQYVAGATRLHWNRNGEADIAGYRVYRGTTPVFAIGPATLVAAVVDTGYTDNAGMPYYYKLTALDSHGNESPVATLLPTTTLGVGDVPGASFFLAGAAPNPAPRGRDAVMRFGLATAGRADLVVMDAAGRRVRTLVAGELAAGEHSVRWDSRSDDGARVHAGLYFVRLVAGGANAKQRLVVIE